MAEHKKQHFIPECYLKAWCDPATPPGQDPFVWRFSKDGSEARRKAPANIFHETDMYTVEMPAGGRNLKIEQGLSYFEGKFVSIRDTKLQRLEPLDDEEHALLCVFVAAMHARTKARRSHLAGRWGKVLAMADDVKRSMEIATPEQRRSMSPFSTLTKSDRTRTLSYEQVKALAEKPLQNTMAASMRAEAPHLSRLDWAVLTSDRDVFITSDDPCVWFDPEAYRRPPMFQSPALMYESIEITFPVSPRQLVLLNRRGVNGYIPAFKIFADEFNRRTRFECDEFFINNRNEVQPIWFDPGLEPEDSWRRRHASENESPDSDA